MTMLVFEFKAYEKSAQITAVDNAILTVKFIQNSWAWLWMNIKNTAKKYLHKSWN
ncbi:MAG: hypothetical protein HWQ43_23400 [Nostoc sp. JL31]|uniref:hypothetical protein n=1 Tax=Nostoc sp. JL31 TaxID=2815395 RepID=UPI0025D8B5DE|nr:hypothetical protein [Nostoc sp. JL31]MBN3891973.1 hypothetical protein [Nostoc sp. JL31]